MVFCSRAHHGGATNIDQFNAGVATERVKIADHQVNGSNPLFFERGEVCGFASVGKNATVDSGMKGFLRILCDNSFHRSRRYSRL